MGFGGSVFQWHPELGISFAYTPTRMAWYDLQNRRGARLQDAVVRCLRATRAGFQKLQGSVKAAEMELKL